MLFEEMRNSGQVPDVPMFNMAIHIAAKSAQIEKAYARPRLSLLIVVPLNATRHDTHRTTRHDTHDTTRHDTRDTTHDTRGVRRFDMSKEMDRLGLPKEAQTYGSLLYACSRVKDFDRAYGPQSLLLSAPHDT